MSKKKTFTNADVANAILRLRQAPNDREAAKTFYGAVSRYFGAIAYKSAMPERLRDDFVSTGVEAAWQLMPNVPIRYSASGELLFIYSAWLRNFPTKRAYEAISKGVVYNRERGLDWEARAVEVLELDQFTEMPQYDASEHSRLEAESLIRPLVNDDQFQMIMLSTGMNEDRAVYDVSAIAKRMGVVKQTVYNQLEQAYATIKASPQRDEIEKALIDLAMSA